MAKHWMGLGETYAVKLDDGDELEISTTLPDIVRVEGIINRSWLDRVPSVTDMLTLFWVAGRRAGLVSSKDRKGWSLTVSDWARIGDDDDEDQDDDEDDDGDEDGSGSLDPIP